MCWGLLGVHCFDMKFIWEKALNLDIITIKSNLFESNQAEKSKLLVVSSGCVGIHGKHEPVE